MKKKDSEAKPQETSTDEESMTFPPVADVEQESKDAVTEVPKPKGRLKHGFLRKS